MHKRICQCQQALRGDDEVESGVAHNLFNRVRKTRESRAYMSIH